MSEQLSFIAPTVPPPAVMAKQEIERARREAERAEIAANARALKASKDAAFERFWVAYAKRPNNPKDPARLSWARALRGYVKEGEQYPPATVEEIMEGLARYEFDPDPRMRAMAVTWINQRRWSVVNEDLDADQFGLSEYLVNLPHDGTLSAACYDVDDLRPILIATGWAPSWRGSLDVLNAWVRDGYNPDSCAKVIAAAVAEFGARGTLAAFDKRVRFRAERINL